MLHVCDCNVASGSPISRLAEYWAAVSTPYITPDPGEAPCQRKTVAARICYATQLNLPLQQSSILPTSNCSAHSEPVPTLM